MAKESAIRDYLAKHLSLVEPNLRLIEVEYRLPNPLGAKGSVDILARDALGHLVVLEVKRATDTSRTALHELHKYLALIQSTYGLGPHQLRCIVASTDWHELLVPFSSFVRTSGYAAEGRRLVCADDGTVENCELVTLAPFCHPLVLCPGHVIVIFDEPRGARSQATLVDIRDRLERAGFTDHCLLELSKDRTSQTAIYVAVAALSEEAKHQVQTNLGLTPPDPSDFEPDSDDFRWWYETEGVAAALLGIDRDQYEIGYPDKLTRVLNQEGWRLLEIQRAGRLASKVAFTNEQLMSMVVGTTGDSSVAFQGMSSPRLTASWDSFCDATARSLTGNEPWANGLAAFLDRCQRTPESSVAAQIFNPMNVLFLLWGATDPRQHVDMPELRAYSTCPGTKTIESIVGRVVWDGRPYTGALDGELDRLIQKEFGFDPKRAFGVAVAMQELWRIETELLSFLGCRYIVDLVRIEGGVELRPENQLDMMSIEDLLRVSPRLLQDVSDLLYDRGVRNFVR